MTDSMKFGPEWLRNMSNDMNTGAGGGGAASTTSSTAPLGPRHQLAEYRYGREEMLSLFDKNLKLPEILPTFKKLFVDKIQCPLALIPSTDDDGVNSAQRPWVMRSPVSFGAPARGGTSRGGSVDRGRGRSRGTYHMSLAFPRPTAVYDEDIRGLGKTERGWPERNGANEVGAGDWNGSPSSSPRKEYNSHGRGSNSENWRRLTRVDDDGGDGWRGIVANNNISASAAYRSSRSTSWRDDDSSATTARSISWREDDSTASASRSGNWGDEDSSSLGPGGDTTIPPITRSFSTSAAVVSSLLDRGGPPLVTNSSSFKTNSTHTNSNDSGGQKSNAQWDTDDSLPEWAMENPTDGGGSFDASGAFHGPNDRNDDENQRQHNRKETLKTDKCGKPKDEAPEKKPDNTTQKALCESNGVAERPKSKDPPKVEHKQPPGNLEISTRPELVEDVNEGAAAMDLPSTSQSLQQTLNSLPKMSSAPEIPDRMQEVDDMVEKLIMDDELTTTIKHNSKPNSSVTTSAVPILRNNSVPSSSPTTALLQPPLVASHPMISQAQGNMGPDPWYYRDPQGQVQGPFTATEMAEWYRAGYFDENLFVRRVCDSRYVPLGELVKICGNSMPFPSSHLIPPLEPDLPIQPPVTHVSAGPPNAQAMISPKPGGSMLPQNDMMTLNLHLQMLQKEYLLRQQNIILSKLAQTEHWPLVSPERQQQMLNQQMSQVVLPDHIMNLTAYANSLAALNPSFALQQMIATKDLNQPKPLQPPPHISLSSFMGGPTDFSATPGLHGLMQNSGSTQQQQPQQPPPPLPPQHHTGPMVDNDPIKTLIRQLQMQKSIQQPPAQQMPQAMPKWPPNIIPHQQPQPWATGSTAPNVATVSMWDFGSLAQSKPEMKTEQQILEEQLQNEKQAEARLIEAEKIPLPMVQMQAAPLPPPQLHQQQQHQQLPSPQMSQTKKEQEKSKSAADDKSARIPKNDDDSKRAAKNKQDKKDNPHSKKLQSSAEDDRKKEAEERKRQKEEKKRAQLEEERRRQQAIEEEKRRQMLEEKKRQEEIDQHRRAKMLENAPPKPPKSTYDGGSGVITNSGRMATSIAPWSNTGLPGIAGPGPSLAEIQKAERERRTEEQRLEQILEHQRKSQQMEMLAQKENAVKWNAQPRKPINVKSLSEIQAEEHKRQLANEQAAVAAAAALVDQSRRKDDIGNQAPGYGNNAFGSIWSTRSPTINTTWKAWSTTSTGFWEEPAKIPISNSIKPPANNNNSNNGAVPRMLSKSQTISNIQTTVKHTNQQGGSTGKQNQTSSNGQQGSGNNANGKHKGAISKMTTRNGNGGGGHINAANSANGKKDDARNEFTSWCIKAMAQIKSSVDVPTFIAFLQDIESPFEVKDYIRLYLGESKECSEFAKQFLERRSKYKNQQRVNAHIDDMCSPAPAINPQSNDFQEVKGKGKKEKKKNKMTKVDGRILGFSVTAAQDRINVGDRDYGDAS